jgi:hypothetical protein
MNKLVLTVPLAAVLAVSMILTPVAYADFHEGTYLDIVAAEVQQNNGLIKLELYTAEDADTGVPAAYGYAAMTEDGQNILAVTTHFGIVDEDPESTEETAFFHTHIVDVVGDCETGAQVSADPDAVGDFKIDGTEIKVTDVPAGSVSTLTGDVISFTIHLEGEGEDLKVCVVPVDAIAELD